MTNPKNTPREDPVVWAQTHPPTYSVGQQVTIIHPDNSSMRVISTIERLYPHPLGPHTHYEDGYIYLARFVGKKHFGPNFQGLLMVGSADLKRWEGGDTNRAGIVCQTL